MKYDTRQLHLVNLIRFIAIILIFNSHSDVLFPKSIKALATGGALGNGLFFIISGYFVNSKKLSFKRILIRFVRLYLPVYFSLIAYCFTSKNYLGSINNVKSFINIIIWPTPYWFVSAAFLGFVLIELAKGFINDKSILCITICFCIVYFLCYFWGLGDVSKWIAEDGKIFNLNVHFKLIYCFYLYFLGFYIHSSRRIIKGRYAIEMMIGGFVFVYFTKALMQQSIIPMKFQFLNQLGVMLFSYGALNASLAFEEQYVLGIRKLISVIDMLSKPSLEAYVLQIILIPVLASIVTVSFPLNYVIVFVIIMALSYGLFLVDNTIVSYLVQQLHE